MNSLTNGMAHTYAAALHAWGYQDVTIHESVPDGRRWITLSLPDGTQREVDNRFDFMGLREAAAEGLPA